MSDKQYEKLKAAGIKLYKIYLSGNTLKKELVPYETLDDSWILIGWLNTSNAYSNDLNTEIRYCSEDRLELQIRKYFEHIRRVKLDELKQVQKELRKLESVAKKNGVIFDK